MAKKINERRKAVILFHTRVDLPLNISLCVKSVMRHFFSHVSRESKLGRSTKATVS